MAEKITDANWTVPDWGNMDLDELVERVRYWATGVLDEPLTEDQIREIARLSFTGVSKGFWYGLERAHPNGKAIHNRARRAH